VQHRYQYTGPHEITIILLDDDGGATTRNIIVFVI
jgi:hypothetical protein